MVGTPLPASGLRPDQRIICTAETQATVIAIVEKDQANLIGAAPDLLEALKFMLAHRRFQMQMHGYGERVPEDAALAEAAIGRAESES